ncbi:MAG: FAD/NAD(P)-binding protein [Coxiellaceae bacterium]|nr:FAD/NAD(P)-binding protein [Coxiellaceae bacterium]
MESFEWMVIGAGPAGIASVGQLLELDVAPEKIVWIDPHFKCGDFGQLWRKVESNTPVESFEFFYNSCKAFHYGTQTKPFFIQHMQADKNCPLLVAAEPMHWITTQLRQQVLSVAGAVQALQPSDGGWLAQVSTGQPLHSQKVILATGAYPRTLDFDQLATIPIVTAFSPEDLAAVINTEDTVAVFGGSQSARSVLENLQPLQPKRIVHFYRHFHTYDYHLGHLNFPHVETFEMTAENLVNNIPHCNKAIYAIGFEKRTVPILGLHRQYDYDHDTGEIAPNIYGLGIAFPELLPHRNAQAEYPNIAVAAFVERVQHLLPYWLTLSSASLTTENV